MTKDNLNLFYYTRRYRTPLFSQTHTFPEPSVLNDFYASINSKMDEKIKHSGEPVLSRTCKTSIFLFPTTAAEIFNNCLNLKNATSEGKDVKNATSEGKDGFPNNFVKFLTPNISKTLVVLINSCMVEENFLKSLELASVVPLFKSGDRQDPSIYRLFSLLPSLSKNVERILYSRLENFRETTNQITPRQFEFRKTL